MSIARNVQNLNLSGFGEQEIGLRTHRHLEHRIVKIDVPKDVREQKIVKNNSKYDSLGTC